MFLLSRYHPDTTDLVVDSGYIHFEYKSLIRIDIFRSNLHFASNSILQQLRCWVRFLNLISSSPSTAGLPREQYEMLFELWSYIWTWKGAMHLQSSLGLKESSVDNLSLFLSICTSFNELLVSEWSRSQTRQSGMFFDQMFAKI